MKVTVWVVARLGSLSSVIVNGALVVPFFWYPKSSPALGDIRSGLGSLALNSTGKRPLSISQLGGDGGSFTALVHCTVFSSKK